MEFKNKQNKSYFEICEVHYDENDKPHMWGEIMPAESLDELKDDYEYICKAFESPVLRVIDDKLVHTSFREPF
ncbi:hypothetical protein HMPREF9372_1229 [Sporosarcina newyorkensis 2681]|uniref:Uncharacterized protein n=1 Tax=Sporosarcina newyorkensis 2681 TaxID=1027292 RepID=F9DQZ9_9BACL|nr:hypothetical protein HMPREF9372_1229 [Sporosarcina newyorkensis 2681]